METAEGDQHCIIRDHSRDSRAVLFSKKKNAPDSHGGNPGRISVFKDAGRFCEAPNVGSNCFKRG